MESMWMRQNCHFRFENSRSPPVVFPIISLITSKSPQLPLQQTLSIGSQNAKVWKGKSLVPCMSSPLSSLKKLPENFLSGTKTKSQQGNAWLDISRGTKRSAMVRWWPLPLDRIGPLSPLSCHKVSIAAFCRTPDYSDQECGGGK